MGPPRRAVELVALIAQLALAGCSRLRSGEGTQTRASRAAPYKQTLYNYENVQYFADFTIGGQKIVGIFDTGSFELIVRSSRCSHCVHPTAPYDHTKSHTYSSNGTVTQHVFGSGPCVSVMGYETVSVGPSLHAERQAFWEIVDHEIQVLDHSKFAAIVGIGPDFAYGNTERTLLMSYGVDVFSICLQKAPGSEGFLIWGPAEEAQLGPQETVSASVIGDHHWVTSLRNVRFSDMKNDGIAPCSGQEQCAVVIDSGTSLIAIPGAAIKRLSAMIPEIKEDCSNLDELPTLIFDIQGHPFELPPEAYVMRVTGAVLKADDVWDILFYKPKMRRLNMCMPAFMELEMMSQHGAIWIMGMPFFRYYYSTFDRARKQMRFASAGPGCIAQPLRGNEHALSNGANATRVLFSAKTQHRRPMDVEVSSIISPMLSGMLASKSRRIVL